MYYQDLIFSQYSRLQQGMHIESLRHSSKHSILNSSRGLEDSGEYISTSITYQIRQQLNQKCFNKNRIAQTILAIFFIILVCLIMPKDVVKRQAILQQNQNNLYVTSQNGTKIQLAYKKPVIITPESLPQNSIGQIIIPNTDSFIKYVQQLGKSIQFNQKLFLNWLNEDENLFQAQFFRFDKKYDFKKQLKQSSICVISPYRNMVSSSQSWRSFLKSVDAQNYSNYKVFMIDDVSTDGSHKQVLKQVKQKYHRLNNRLNIVKNVQNIGALGNRDVTIRNLCKNGDIIVDIDGDDALIGKQVFNMVNRLYNMNTQAWFIYNNYLAVSGRIKGQRNANIHQKMRPGISKTISSEIFTANSYRLSLHQWVTSQLRTYLRDLYVKIPLGHVLQPGTRKYYIQASDRFSMYSLVQLAGKQHTLFVQQYVYFYFQPNFLILEQKGCTLPLLFYNQAQARMLTPLLQLPSLQKQAELTKDYVISPEITLYYVQAQQKYLNCLSKLQQKKLKQKNNHKP